MGIDVTVKAVLRLCARGAGDRPMKIKLKNDKTKKNIKTQGSLNRETF